MLLIGFYSLVSQLKMKVCYGLTTQLVWVKIIGEQHSADNFVLVLDDENFKKLIAQANDLLTNKE